MLSLCGTGLGTGSHMPTSVQIPRPENTEHTCMCPGQWQAGGLKEVDYSTTRVFFFLSHLFLSCVYTIMKFLKRKISILKPRDLKIKNGKSGTSRWHVVKALDPHGQVRLKSQTWQLACARSLSLSTTHAL